MPTDAASSSKQAKDLKAPISTKFLSNKKPQQTNHIEYNL